MKKVFDGIYRLDGELIVPRQRLLVLVHQWFEIEMGGKYVPYFGSGDYLRKLDVVLHKSWSREIFLFEALRESMVADTFRRITGLRGTKGLHTIFTNEGGMEVIEGSTEGVMDYLAEYSDGFDLAGGYLWGGKNDEFSGCAGYAHKHLRKRNAQVNILGDCCFIAVIADMPWRDEYRRSRKKE